MDSVVHSVVSEEHRGLTKFGPYNSQHEAYAIIKEELDELWQEIKHGTNVRAVNEARQVAATALRFVREYGVR